MKRLAKAEAKVRRIVDFQRFKIKEENLTPRQKQFIHLVDGRFFSGGANPYQKGDFAYETPLDLEEDIFYLHALMDPQVLEAGAVRRFPQSVNRHYIEEKYKEDQWVSEGNNALALGLRGYIQGSIERLRKQEKIKLLDIGPCGGAITTLFALRELANHGLLEKVEVYLLDIVPQVLKATKSGEFDIPPEMIAEYRLGFAGLSGERYKRLVMSNRVKAVLGDGRAIPAEIKGMDIVLAGYVHHHMNLYERVGLAQQMEETARTGGFIGVVDFYVKTFSEYMGWYRPHFQKHMTPPPVECPVVGLEWLSSQYRRTKISMLCDTLEKSFMFWGVRE